MIKSMLENIAKSTKEINLENDFLLLEFENNSEKKQYFERDIDNTFIQLHFCLRGNCKFSFNNGNYSLDVLDKHGVLSDITRTMSKNRISIKRLIQNPIRTKSYASIIIITHLAKDISYSSMLNQLNKKNYIISKPKIIRIENIQWQFIRIF